jgi:hypothetical protein
MTGPESTDQLQSEREIGGPGTNGQDVGPGPLDEQESVRQVSSGLDEWYGDDVIKVQHEVDIDAGHLEGRIGALQ